MLPNECLKQFIILLNSDSVKPSPGGTGVRDYYAYEQGDEKLIVKPYAAFYVSELQGKDAKHFMVLVLPKYDIDLESYKNKYDPNGETIKNIILKIGRGIIYLNEVRAQIHKDIKLELNKSVDESTFFHSVFPNVSHVF